MKMTIKDAAACLGLTPSGLRQSYLPHLPPDAIDKTKPMTVDMQSLVSLRVERLVAERLRMEFVDIDAADSPALERYRLAKAKLAELELEVRRGTVIEVAKSKEVLARWAALIRDMGERLSRSFGNDAALMVNETIDECRESVREVYGVLKEAKKK